MDTVSISPRFEIRLPRRVREELGLAPGQRLRVLHYAGRIELVPFRPVFECAGLLTEVPGDGDSETAKE